MARPRRARGVAAPEAVEDAPGGVSGQPFARVLDRHLHFLLSRLDDDCDRAVRGGMPEGVRDQVEEDALDLVGRAAHVGAAVVEARLESHVSRPRFRLEPAQARLDEAGKLRLADLEREHACIDTRQLEEIVDEPAERAHLLAHGGQVALGLGQPVLDRLEHGLQGREWRP